jgi:hypothetical protein
MDAKLFGYEVCRQCSTAVLDIVAAKTSGLCPDCFRERTNPFLTAVVAHNNSGERVRLRLVRKRRSPAYKAGKKRAKGRNREHAKIVRQAQARAARRLRELYPDVYEVLLADERAGAGLQPWTIERALTCHRPYSHFDELAKYAGINNPLAS